MGDSICTWHLNDFARGAIEGAGLALTVLAALVFLALYLVSLRYDATLLLRWRK